MVPGVGDGMADVVVGAEDVKDELDALDAVGGVAEDVADAPGAVDDLAGVAEVLVVLGRGLVCC